MAPAPSARRPRADSSPTARGPTDPWEGAIHRPGDIVVSTRSKCGTTWMQMMCLLLVHQTVPLPAPLAELSPWLGWSKDPGGAARLAAQDHRRVIKTHTPLAGLPLRDDVTYVVVGRHPLDVAVSLWHHVDNITDPSGGERPTLDDWLDRWVDDRTPVGGVDLDTLASNVDHVADARARAGDLDVVLRHFDELQVDCEGTMRRLADRLGIAVPADRWPTLAAAAGFDAMRAGADRTAPDPGGVLHDRSAFFRGGRSGDGWAACTPDQRARYLERIHQLADDDVVAWLHGAS